MHLIHILGGITFLLLLRGGVLRCLEQGLQRYHMIYLARLLKSNNHNQVRHAGFCGRRLLFHGLHVLNSLFMGPDACALVHECQDVIKI